MAIECNLGKERVVIFGKKGRNNWIECDICMPLVKGRIVVIDDRVAACEKRLKTATTEELMRSGGVDREFFESEPE